MKNLTKFTVWLCSFILLASLLTMGATAAENPAYTGALGSIDMDRSNMDADVSCMTFNVLHYNTSTVQNYGSGDYSTRLNYAVSLIRAYDPDIIGMQEAGNDSNHTEKWPADLEANLGDTYTPILLTDLTDNLSQMYITNGLVIWYRTSRFTLLDSGAECYWSYSNDCAVTSKDRWYQWAKLYDNQEGKTLFVFNTHLSTNHSASVCSVCTSSTEGASVGQQQRTNELVKLSDQIHALSQNYPCFVTGDFNCTMANSIANQSDSTRQQLLAMSASPHSYLRSTLETADLQQTSDGNNSIDHVFINTNYLHARKLVGIRESVGGYIGSDHIPYIAYCDYRAAADIGPGDYDETQRTYTDTTDARQYTFEVTPADGFTYKIFKDTGTQTGNTIWSVKDTSKYQIRFYDPDGALYSSVDATIYATSAAKPTLSSTGLNQYFANHAYHVVADGPSVTVTAACSGINTAEIYSDEACANPISGGVLTNIPAGRTTVYLKHNVYTSTGTLNFSEVFPLYIYRQTAPTRSMALYVDQNIGDATGTVAFWDGTDVHLAEGQVTGFSSLTAAQPTVNTADGYSIYMAPGEYEGNASSFTKSFSLYGANWDISPNNRVLEGTWSMADRREETVINGQLLISLYGNSVTTKSIAVRGVTFTGETKQGAIYIIENRGGTGSSYWATNSAYEVELDIRNNIFLGWSTQSSSAHINLNCASQKSGIIACNYFGQEKGRSVSNDTETYPLTWCNAIFGRNINGLLIDSNRFVGFGKDFLSLTSEIGYGSTLPGYGVYTVQDNRFENCISTLNRICNITGGTRADVKYLGNYFIRCGYGTGVIFTETTEATGTTTDFASCALTVMGNKFYECERSFGIFRNGITLNGDMNDMAITLSQNAFHNPCERAMQPKNGYSTGTAAENYTYSYQSYNYSPIYFRLANTGQTEVDVSPAWNLSHNYFYSARLANDFTNSNHPSLYVNSYMKEWSNGGVSAEYECLNATFEAAFVPYYTNHGCTGASSTDSTDTKPTSATVSSVSGITATGYSGSYDGKTHNITVSAPEGAFVSYSYGDSAPAGYKSYSATNPEFTEIGSYTVTYRVIAPGCMATYGTAVVNITERNPAIVPQYPTLAFESQIQYNVYFTTTDLEDVSLSDMGLITWDTAQSDGTMATAQNTISGAVTTGTDGMYMVHTDGIAAKYLGDTVYFKVYTKLSDGTYVYSDLYAYNAKAYAQDRLANSTNPRMKALVVAMLNYGAAAQQHFGYKTDDLMNAFLTDEQKALVDDYNAGMVSGLAAVDSAKVGSFKAVSGGYSALAPSVAFEGAFAINFYFTPAKAMDGDLTLYYWTLDDYNTADVLTPENASGKVIMEPSGSSYFGAVEGIAAKEIDRTVFVSGVYESGGVSYCTGVIAYSLATYCLDRIANGSETMQAFAARTAVYGYYAKEYFAAL